MKKNTLFLIISITVLVVIGCFLWNAKHTTPQHITKVKIGWQTAWATQGQVIQALINTNITNIYNSNAEFISFLYGPDQNEAAITKNIDVTNSGIVPTVNLLASDDDWIIIGRQIDFLVSIVVRPSSGINRVTDLKDKKLGVPFGGGSHPYAIEKVLNAGLQIGDGKNQVQFINLKPSEHSIAMQEGNIDAVATWEPTTSALVSNGNIVVDSFRHTGFIAVRKSFAENNKEQIINLLKSYIEAQFYVSQNREQTDKWFSKISSIKLELIQKIKPIEPNLIAKKIQDINISINQNDIALTQKVSDIMFENKISKKPIIVSDRVDMSYLNQALKELKIEGYMSNKIISNK